MRTCKTAGCGRVPSGSLRWCDDCLVTWSTTGSLPALREASTTAITPAPVVALDVVPDGYHRCGNCTGLFRVLVDDLLCMRCDGVLFPTSPVPTPAPAPVVVELREAS